MVATGSGGLEEHMARFTLPRDLYHGKGALEALKDFEGKRAMICVGGGSMKRFGFLDRAKQYLDRKSTRLNSSHDRQSRMPSSA